MANTLTAQDFAILQQFVNNQDRYGYWNYLAARGDAYAALALGVVTGANSEGFVANAYAATYAPKGSDLANANIVTKAWWGIGVGLMTADLQARQKLENPGDSSLDLSFKTILEYHKKVFADNTPSLPPQAWTPYVPFEGYINGGDWTTANQKWHQMISGGVNEYIASLTALANSGGALVTDKTAWLATTGAISTGYANLVATQGNTRIALLNANYINGWSYDKSSGQWINEQMALAGLGAGALFAVADAVTAAQLNQERQNRLARFGGHALQISGVMDASWNDGRGTLYDGAQQLAGTQNSPTQANGSIVWTDANQVQYEFSLSINPTIGTMKISGGVLASTGGPLVIDNFDLNQAETNSDGYLGIKLQEKSALSAHSSGGSGTGGSGNSGSGDSFRDGNYQPSDITATTQGVVQALTVYASAISDKAQTVILTLNNADASQFKINTGEDFRAFDGSSVKLTIPAGSDSVTVGLLYLGDPAQSQTVQLTSALTDADGAPDKASTTNTLTVTYDNSHAPGDPTYVVQGNPDKQNIWGKADDGDYIYDARDKTAQNFVSVDHGPAVVLGNNGDNLVLGNGQRGLYFAGNGNNRVYADQKVDLATALANAATATATGQQGSVIGVGDGNNTIVGGNNDDAILAGTGNNTVVLGAGNDTFLGGVEILGGSLEWSASLTPLDSDPNAKLLNLKHVLWAPAAYDEPEDYEGNRSLTGAPFGMGNDVIFGGSGSHLVELSNGDNYVDAGSGDSTIDGGMGDNTIFGGTGNVVVRAGGGDDYIDSESGNDKVAGGGGDNTIFGGSGNDTIFAGGSGDAWATSEKGNNYVEAGSGNSVLYGSGGNDTLIAGAGHDTLHAGAGNEYLQGGTGDTLMFGGSGNDTLVAGDGNDTISAGTGNTTIHGGDGADQIYGGAGKTLIYAGDGGTSSTPTQIVAGTGDTTVYGGGGIDLIFGGSGSNVLYAGDGGTAEQATGVVAGDGDTTVYGGSGIDIIVGGAGKDVLYAGAGGIEDNPTYVLGGSSDSTLVAGSGVSQLVAGGGNTTFVFNADSGKATIQGGGGCTLEFGSGIGVSDLTLSAVRAFDGSAALSIEVATGGSITVLGGLTGSIGLIRFADGSALNMNDLMAQANVMPATIETSSGLVSFGDADSSSAGSGDTIHYAARSDDTLTGGAGNDTFVIDSPDQVVVSQPNQGTDTIQASVSYTLPDNVNNLTLTGTADLTGVGNSLDNVITGNAGNNTLIAGSGNAMLIGGGGADTMIGGMGNTTFVVEDASDVVIAQPDAGTSTVQSSVSFVLPEHANKLTLTGSDNLVGTGNALANAISANAGDDTLIGGGGDDTLIGGAGKDTFVFTKGDGADMVIGGTGGKNTILLSDDIASSDLSATQLGNDLLLQVSGTKASFLVQDYFTNAQTWMLMSSAGTSLSLDEIIRRSSEAGVEAKVDGYRTAFFSALQNALNLPSVPVTTVTATKHLETTTTTEKVSDPEYRFVSNDAIASYLASQHETKTSLPAGSVPVYGEGSDGDLSIIGYNVLIGQTTRWVTHTSSHEVTDYSYTTSYASASSQGAAISLVHGGSEGEGLAMSGPFNAVDAGAGDDFVSDGVSGDPSALTGDTRWEYKSLSGDPLQNKFAFGLSANFIYGGDGNDTLIGTGDNDMLIGGSDDDTLSGGAGADVYTALKGNGEGWDLIVDTGVVTVTKPPLSDDMTDSDRQLLAGLTRIGNSYALNKAAIDAYREIALNHSGYSTVDEAARDVGSIGYALYGVYGTTDILDSSVDSSRFPKANEYDKILEKFRNYGVMPTDTVQFDAGITLADLRYSFGTVDLDKQRTTLNISWGEDSGIKVVLADADDPVGYGVEFFKFSDGMVLGMSQMLALANPQPADVFTFKPGIGSTVLPSTVDKIAVDQGILPGDVAVSRDGTDLLISSHAGADAVRVSDWYREPGTQPNLTITFADGTVWDATALTAQGLAVTDTAGNKTLTGLTGFANVLTAGINDTLVGGGGNDTFIVNAGMGAIHINATGSNNTLKFGAGITADTITLGTGSLLLRVGTQGDVVHIEGFDPSNALGSGSIQRFSFADGSVLTYEQLLAKGFDLYGTDGNDTLTGTSAANRFYGGMGDDTYVVRHSNDVIIEKAGGGLDTVLSSVSYVLPANVENLTLTGTADLTATGNGLNNVITGNGGNDTLIGGTGSDTLVAGASIATMAGGKGSDTYVVNNAADVINEQESQGTDTIVASVSYVLPANVENLTLTGTDNLTATGNDLNNVITGNAGNDTLIAGSGKATLVGGSGVDTMIGGLGHNTYKVNNSNDVIVAKADALS
ncbi:MAG TPA: calcium-binding protein, partial [Noviherbaspirillum sp.]